MQVPGCEGLGHLLGHKMRPRYDTAETEPEYLKVFFGRLSSIGKLSYPKFMTSRTYVCDVCERCGYTVRREAV